MTQEKIQEFTRRLSQCNKSEMVLINYEIAFTFMDDAKEALNQNNHDEFKNNIQRAQKSVLELKKALNLDFEIAKNLNEIYIYVNKKLSESLYKQESEQIDEARGLLDRLYESFAVAAKEDTSEPLMENAQKVVAGMTYGKDDLTETYTNDSNRGFLV